MMVKVNLSRKNVLKPAQALFIYHLRPRLQA